MSMKPKCPFCSNGKAWKIGTVIRQKGNKQRYICNTCGKTFYLPEVID
jgi:transposase-like protein